jgi:spore germination protein YaaH
VAYLPGHDYHAYIPSLRRTPDEFAAKVGKQIQITETGCLVLDQMKNCIVLSGQYRSFDRNCDSIKQFIETDHLDVYCHLWCNNKKKLITLTTNWTPKQLVFHDFSRIPESFESIESRILKNNPKRQKSR